MEYRLIKGICHICKYKMVVSDNNEIRYVFYHLDEEEANQSLELHKQISELSAEVIPLNISDCIWLDGKEFSSETEIIQAYEMGEIEYTKFLLEQERLTNKSLLNELKLLGQTQTDLELDMIEQGQYITELELKFLERGEESV